MEVLPPGSTRDWSCDFEQAISGQATWTVLPSGVVTATRVSENLGSGLATAKIAANAAKLGEVYEVIVSAPISGGITDPRTFTFRVCPAAVN